MKRGVLLAVSLMLFILIPGAAFSDEVTVNLQSRVIEDFDDPEGSPWMVRGSKFSSIIETDSGQDVYPKSGFIATWPEPLYRRPPQDKDLKVFGVHGKFDRMGYNFIEIIPAKKGEDGKLEPRTIPIPGRVKNMDVWVWGSNFKYYLEAHIMDHKGITHTLDFGDINFIGWRNLQVNIPGHISQSIMQVPALKGLELVKFVLWTRPSERVDNFYFYLDEVKVFTDLFETPFYGEDLTDPEMVEKLWSEAAGTN